MTSEFTPKKKRRTLTRRAILGAMGIGVLGAAGYAGGGEIPGRPGHTDRNPVATENAETGDRRWRPDARGVATSTDAHGEIQGYASLTSVERGETIDFHVSTSGAEQYRISIYRLGHYQGAGARLMTTSPPLAGSARQIPDCDPETGSVGCEWPVSWTLGVPRSWTSGTYIAVFDTVSGRRGYTPFVVRELDRAADLLVVLPFTTYQGYNLWPVIGRSGKSFYNGHNPDGTLGGHKNRAFTVCFRRPYQDAGLPVWFEMDQNFVHWAEGNGYDATYASSVDLHAGRVDPSRYKAIVFPGHDEYWTTPMRSALEDALAAGTHVAFLGANNVYWHTRVEPDSNGVAHGHVTCYKEAPDPYAGDEGTTVKFRDLPGMAEQALIGVMYNGLPHRPEPLVVKGARHWFWSGTGLKNGDKIPAMVAIEADGVDGASPNPSGAQRTLLSASPYKHRGAHKRVQNTSLVEYDSGTMVFVAGTFFWPLALYKEGQINEHVRRATTNLLGRMIGPPA
ncbi:hypothetical protein Afil01_58450 [Actinorhabdospora filicis]|uniref:N,N-dimethylformamidase beta subunit-like C-terminal domain-containing protein n=1 Tax=Actinorhabdospora filicis TaxID=1785913 RepID=A0A9W6WCF8_9ACTN|nr:N,N-dimethylformamidase beta subunit family domain-containing protein [Actinorhabdospora filicis]GLZ81038.1 hypothetical protein Afil01_58450 [Actinorhabdospora filicis]